MNEYFVEVNNKIKKVFIDDDKVILNEKSFNFQLINQNNFHYFLTLNNKTHDITVVSSSKEKIVILINGNYFETAVQTKLENIASNILSKTSKTAHHSVVKSPMPGMVLKIKKNTGDEIKLGDSVLILEAMKMENDIKTPYSGKIKEIFVNENSAVEKGTNLFSIE